MQNIFDTLINSFIETKVGIADDFLSSTLSTHLKENLEALYSENKLQHAGTGNKTSTQNKAVRSDIIYWLDRSHNNVYENIFLDQVDEFILHLNNTCYTGITGYEFHYALYEKGSFYTKHLDQFRNNDSRKYSVIIYLNENWQPQDGGELCIHHSGHTQNISPESGKAIFFKSSEMEHEVLLTNAPRMSITGWLKV